MNVYLDFEKPFADIQARVMELRSMAEEDSSLKLDEEIKRLEEKAQETLEGLYAKLTPWERTQIARHPDRPHCLDYVEALVSDFSPLAGDRRFGEDPAIVAGLGRIDGEPIALIGHEKGNDVESRVRRNFGSARPEGYRKAARVMELADRFSLPVVTLVDTAGAYPGVGAEERGQAEAIARSTQACLDLRAPLVSAIIGEGGSGGAIAIAAANRVHMLEHAIYSVISPEGAASILWRDAAKAQEVAEAMKITAEDLERLGVIDSVIEEPCGGAHRNREAVIESVAKAIRESLKELSSLPGDELRKRRHEKFLAIGRSLQ